MKTGTKPKTFNMVMPDDLKYRASKIAKRKFLSLAGYVCSTMAEQVERDEKSTA